MQFGRVRGLVKANRRVATRNPPQAFENSLRPQFGGPCALTSAQLLPPIGRGVSRKPILGPDEELHNKLQG